MKAIVVMFDTLCRHFLSPYGNNWVQTPNFQRLAKRTAQFQNAYVGSMPCMPARREMHTGRYNFLHRSWGPLEPFDHSVPQILKESGVHTHTVTDHYHYWEDGGATYHNRYSTCEFVRGQEGDAWKGWAGPVDEGEQLLPFSKYPKRRQDWINRWWMKRDEDMPQHITFSQGIDHIRRNKDFDNWFVQIETFDPHEPFFSQKRWQDLYPHDYRGPHFDWPPYAPITQDKETVHHIHCMFAALMSFCDANLGRVLDVMDEQDMWKDTLLIVNTDHGFLMGEHDWWAKCVQPFYQEIAHIPLWIWDPRSQVAGVQRNSLVQTIDFGPTILDFFGRPIPSDVQGHSLLRTVADDTPVRQAGLFGIHGGHVNVTDGRYVYMRGAGTPDNAPLYEYTVMPTHMNARFAVKELQEWEKHPAFGFTQGVPAMRVPARLPGKADTIANPRWSGTFLYDILADPHQQRPLQDAAVERMMIDHLVRLMRENEAPAEQYVRLGLPSPV